MSWAALFRSKIIHKPAGPLCCSLLAALLAVGACSSDGESSGCTPGESQSCTGPAGCDGSQVCSDDGARFDACACDGTMANAGSGGSGNMSAGAGGSMMAGSAGMMASGGSNIDVDPASIRTVGAACTVDGDCFDGLTCITEGSTDIFPGGGGPAEGYCSLPCTTTEECQRADPLTGCGNLGYCLARCQFGTMQPGGNPPVKCTDEGGARLQACFPPSDLSMTTIGTCTPRCRSNADCTDGRVCDIGQSGLCVAAPPAGAAVGEACQADEDCAGQVCLEIDGGSFCSGFCTFGLGGCGYADGDVAEAACADTVVLSGSLGDLGFCFELCDTEADCAQDGFVCETMSIASTYGRVGICYPPLP